VTADTKVVAAEAFQRVARAETMGCRGKGNNEGCEELKMKN
jgi:hypothetical protein